MCIADTSITFPVFLVYDIMLTLKDEISQIWRRKPSPVMVLYFLNRYGPVLALIPIIIKCFAAPDAEVSKLIPPLMDM